MCTLHLLGLHGAWIARLQPLDAVHLNAQYQAMPSSHISQRFLCSSRIDPLTMRSSIVVVVNRLAAWAHGGVPAPDPVGSQPQEARMHALDDGTSTSCAVHPTAGRCAGQLAAQFPLLSRPVPAMAALLCAIFGPAQGYFFQIGGALVSHRPRVGSGPI